MKKLRILIFSLFVFLLIPLFSSQEDSVIDVDMACERISVETSQVLLSEKGIVFDASSGMPRETRALRFDEKGYYVLSSDEYWTCPYCESENSGRRLCGTRCANCGRPERC